MNNEESCVETQSEIPRKMEELKETFVRLHQLVSDLETRLSSVLAKPVQEVVSASTKTESINLTSTELGEKLEDLKCGAASLELYISDIRKRIRL
jgi:predicted  nucleic acid-binding Zn-ribbon protein